ncbi:hypothetical protein FHG87_019243 [Trinorchestia longiramus]|nr:hypothetical protein FHG87_019243 [Trinorchestia longiramus]
MSGIALPVFETESKKEENTERVGDEMLQKYCRRDTFDCSKCVSKLFDGLDCQVYNEVQVIEKVDKQRTVKQSCEIRTIAVCWRSIDEWLSDKSAASNYVNCTHTTTTTTTITTTTITTTTITTTTTTTTT